MSVGVYSKCLFLQPDNYVCEDQEGGTTRAWFVYDKPYKCSQIVFLVVSVRRPTACIHTQTTLCGFTCLTMRDEYIIIVIIISVRVHPLKLYGFSL